MGTLPSKGIPGKSEILGNFKKCILSFSGNHLQQLLASNKNERVLGGLRVVLAIRTVS